MKTKTVPGTRGRYTVSEDGTFFSVRRNAPIQASDAGRAMQLRAWDGKRYNCLTASRIVFEAFHRKLRKGERVAYRDGDYRNVAACNLYARTTSERSLSSAHLFMGEASPTAKITEATAESIIRDRMAGMSLSQASAKYGLYFTTISKISRGLNWGHVHWRVTQGAAACFNHPG